MSGVDDFRRFLLRRGVRFREQAANGNTEFRCQDGEVFTVHPSGRVHAQTVVSPLSQTVQAMSSLKDGEVGDLLRFVWDSSKPMRMSPADRRIFIVHGHDTVARNHLELLLRRMNMEPVVLVNLPAQGDTIIEKLERYLGHANNVGFAVALLTPDDEGHRVGRPDEKRLRARQNVILELGMVFGRLGRSRVTVLHRGSVELPSDIAGLIYHEFKATVDEAKTQLFQDLRNAGYQPDPDGL